ncbi:MAG: hypothetical protein ACRCTD_01800 [Beijerinckiaceae bacterium]
MADKSSFTPEEWNTLLGSVLLSGVAVTAAEPSGILGLLKEGMAGGRLLMEQTQNPSNPLMQAIAQDFTTGEGRTAARSTVSARMAGAQRTDMKTRALGGLSEAVAIINAKAPGEAQAYKTFIAAIADATANAASEGGFLGFGGTQVSDAEKATLADIQTILAKV